MSKMTYEIKMSYFCMFAPSCDNTSRFLTHTWVIPAANESYIIRKTKERIIIPVFVDWQPILSQLNLE